MITTPNKTLRGNSIPVYSLLRPEVEIMSVFLTNQDRVEPIPSVCNRSNSVHGYLASLLKWWNHVMGTTNAMSIQSLQINNTARRSVSFACPKCTMAPWCCCIQANLLNGAKLDFIVQLFIDCLLPVDWHNSWCVYCSLVTLSTWFDMHFHGRPCHKW